MRSGFETQIRNLFKRNKVDFEYEPYKVAYTLIKNYIPDFVLPNGILIEAKGWLRPTDRTKLIAVKKSNPNLDLRIWFQADNYLTKKKHSKYSDWAKKNGFPFHVGTTLPKEWVEFKR